MSDVYKFISCLRSAICPLGDISEAECEQALSTLFHVLFTMARMMVCGGGEGSQGDPGKVLQKHTQKACLGLCTVSLLCFHPLSLLSVYLSPSLAPFTTHAGTSHYLLYVHISTVIHVHHIT